MRLPKALRDRLSITRDNAGVPHIDAKDVNAAMWGLGYCHAIDRGTQLQMMRILGQGRVCELLKDNDESLAIDRFFRRAGWHQSLDDQVAQISADSLAVCQAFCDGINAGFAKRRFSMLRVLGVKAETWTIAHSILLMRMAGYLTLAQSQAEIERFYVECLQSEMPDEAIASLFPDDAGVDRATLKKVTLGERLVPDQLWNMAIPRMMASNNWVIAADKTAGGAPIMANDPHLEVNRLPNVWYEAAVRWPDHELLGMGMPGLPGILIGRNQHVAWGATYTFMDTVDSWVEHCQNGQYKKEGEWHTFGCREERIVRKKHADDVSQYYENDHGVLDGNPNNDGYYLATRWSPAQSGAQSVESSIQLLTITDASQAMHALGRIESAWNWVIADADNIAYQMSGLMPKRKAAWSGLAPAPGWDASYDWQGFISPEELPRCINPEQGFIVTANQDLNHLGVAKPINMPMGDYRAQRISQQLMASNDHTLVSCGQLQMDCYSLQAQTFLSILLPLLAQRSDAVHLSAAQLLQDWDCCYDTDSQAAVLFEEFYVKLREIVFSQQGMSAEILRQLHSDTGLFIDFYQNFDRNMLNPESPWFATQNQGQAFLLAFDHAAQGTTEAAQTWGQLNSLRLSNQLLQGPWADKLGISKGPIALRGGRSTVHQGQIYNSAGRVTSFAPSVRLLAQLNSTVLHTSMAGGPSDRPFSRWYSSGLSGWLSGHLKTLKW